MTDDRHPQKPDPRGRLWFEHLFRDHHLEVLSYARRRVGEEADDIVSDVFTTAWQRRSVVPDDALPWLYRTAANHVLHARRSWARRARAVAPPSPEPDFTDTLDDEDLVVRALRRLPERDQEILRLWAWEQLEPPRIGEVLDCSAATARVRLHRARRRLQDQLELTPQVSTLQENR